MTTLRTARGFTVLFVAATLARLGSEMLTVAVVLFVLKRTDSAQLAGLTVAASTLPTIVTGPVMGVWLDRVRGRRAVFLGAQVLFVLAVGGFLLAAGRVPDQVLVGLGLAAGLPYPIRTGGFSGLIPTVVPPALIGRAYGVEAVSYNLAGVAGPALAGVLAGTVSPGWAMGATAMLGVAAFGVLLRVPIAAPATVERGRVGAALRDGFGLLAAVRPLRSVTVATTLSQASVGLLVVAFPMLAAAVGGSRADGGLLFSVFAAGALAGSTAWTRLAGRVAAEPAVLVGLAIFAGAMGLVAAASTLPLALAAAGGAGLIDGPVLAATLTLRQEHSPDRLRTQVFTTAASLKIGAFAIGSALTGPAATLGAHGMLGLVAGAQLAALGLGLGVRGRAPHSTTRASALTP